MKNKKREPAPRGQCRNCGRPVPSILIGKRLKQGQVSSRRPRFCSGDCRVEWQQTFRK